MYKKISLTLLICILIGAFFYYRYQLHSENHADAALQSGYINYKNNKPLQAMGDFSFLADYYGNRHNHTIQQIVAKGLLKKAEILTQIHDIDGAILVYEQLSNLYMNKSNHKLHKDIAWARFQEGNLLLQQKRYEEAMIPYSYLVSAYSKDTDIKIQRIIAEVMHNETVILNQTGHPDTALNIHSAIIERFSKSTDPQIRLVLAESVMARTRKRLDNKEWGLALYNSNAFIKLFTQDQTPIIKKYLIQNLLYRAEILHKDTKITDSEQDLFGKNPQEAALHTYDDALTHIKAENNRNDRDYPYYQAIALLGKAQIFSKDKTDQSLLLCDQIYQSFSQSTDIRIHKIVAGSLITKGQILTERHQFSQAISTYASLLTHYQPNTDPNQQALNETIIDAYLNQSKILVQLKNNQQALTILDKVIAQYKDTTDEKLYYKLSNAILFKAEQLVKMKQYDQAIATYTGFIAVAHHKNYLFTRYNGASAIIKKANLLIFLHKGQEIGQTFAQLNNFYLDDKNIEIRRVVAQGMYDHAEGLFKSNRGYTALDILDTINAHFQKNQNDPTIKDILNKTQQLKKQLDASIVI